MENTTQLLEAPIEKTVLPKKSLRSTKGVFPKFPNGEVLINSLYVSYPDIPQGIKTVPFEEISTVVTRGRNIADFFSRLGLRVTQATCFIPGERFTEFTISYFTDDESRVNEIALECGIKRCESEEEL